VRGILPNARRAVDLPPPRSDPAGTMIALHARRHLRGDVSAAVAPVSFSGDACLGW
jgi:hypothetical protein